MLITLDNVSKRFASGIALAPTSLSFLERGTTVLIGPSGCGKSTLLRIIIGLVRPDTGTVLVDGVRVKDAAMRALRLRTGYVIQDGGLFPHLTARQNVALAAREIGWTHARITERIEELSALVHLDADVLARYPVEISGGQRQRVGLMRALMLGPDLLLLDEPLGALDPMVRAELQRDLKSIFERLGTTVIMVTHDLAEASYFGNAIILMRSGHVVQSGSIDDLVSRPADPFVTAFISAQRLLHEVTQ